MKRRGTGFTLAQGTQVCTEDSDSRNRRCVAVDLLAEPFGPDGDANAPDRALLGRRYAGGPDAYPTTRQAIGLWAETFALNGTALASWYAEQPEAHREQWDGVATNREMYDLAHWRPRRADEFYRRHVFSRGAGGTPETAIILDRGNVDAPSWWGGHGWRFSIPVSDPAHLFRKLGLQVAQNDLGYDVFFDVQALPGGVEEPPPPPPPPPPPLPPTAGLSPISQRVEELSIRLDRILSVGPAWLRKMRNEARKAEGDLVRTGLYWLVYAKRAMVAVVHQLLGKDWTP